MSPEGSASIAIYAAGIADAFRLCQCTDGNGVERCDQLTHIFGGWDVVMEQIAEAALCMEKHRSALSHNALWGREMPPIYDVWDAIGQGLWKRLGDDDVSRIVARAIAATRNA